MPFTFSHPAAVLPITYLPNKYYSLTGLIMGSMAPDFEYFIRMRLSGQYGHSWPGVLYFDLPIGILLCFIFHNIVRDPLLNNLPGFLQKRFRTFERLDWNRWFRQNFLVVIGSIIVGASSHILWDSFTHETGYFVKRLPELQREVRIADFALPIYRLFQRGSTLVGALVIAYAISLLPKSPDSAETTFEVRYWILMTAPAVGMVAFRLATGLAIEAYATVIVTFISGGMLGLILASLVYKNRSIHLKP